MANVCLEINCPRDIGRQILRHRSFTFQEFSGRYAEYDDLLETREVRLLDAKNRQNSLHCDDPKLQSKWAKRVAKVRRTSLRAYRTALSLGIAKEVARVLLPEGLVPSRMYVNGTVRSWIHYINLRSGPETQKEHREVAEQAKKIFVSELPRLSAVLGWTSE